MYYYSSNYEYPYRQNATTTIQAKTPSLMTSLGEVELEGYYDLFVYETLLSVIGATLKVQMSRGSIEGKLIGAKPDHVILESNGNTFFIRIKEIVWIMPAK